MGTLAQSSPTMQGLLVLASLTVISAQILPYGGLGSPYGYSGLGLGYGGLGLPYSYGANVLKPVVKEIEVPVETIKFEAAATGCSNSFGNPVPCLQEGEARKKRQADDEAEAEDAPATVLPLGYAGLGYAGLGYAGLGYNGLGYAVLDTTVLVMPVLDMPVSPDFLTPPSPPPPRLSRRSPSTSSSPGDVCVPDPGLVLGVDCA